MASEPNEPWTAHRNPYPRLIGPGTVLGLPSHISDAELLAWIKVADYLNALEARATRAEERLQVAVEGLKDIANGDAERWQWTDANPDMQSYYFIKAGEDIMCIATSTLAKLDTSPTEVQR